MQPGFNRQERAFTRGVTRDGLVCDLANALRVRPTQ